MRCVQTDKHSRFSVEGQLAWHQGRYGRILGCPGACGLTGDEGEREQAIDHSTHRGPVVPGGLRVVALPAPAKRTTLLIRSLDVHDAARHAAEVYRINVVVVGGTTKPLRLDPPAGGTKTIQARAGNPRHHFGTTWTKRLSPSGSPLKR